MVVFLGMILLKAVVKDIQTSLLAMRLCLPQSLYIKHRLYQ
jgi:hypothetical protein